MLPFLKPKNVASTIISNRKKDGQPNAEKRSDEASAELMQHTESLMQGMATKDSSQVARSLQSILSLKNQGE